VIAATLLAATLGATSTRCATTDFIFSQGPITYTDRRLIGCGPQYIDNVLWNLDRGDAIVDATATRRTTGKGSVVYVIDTGVEASHDEFQRDGGTTNVIAGLEAATVKPSAQCPDDSPTHPCSVSLAAAFTHGTAVASIVAGRTTGIAPDTSIVSVRVFAFTATDPDQVSVFNRALDLIVMHAWSDSAPPFQTAIINMSATFGTFDPDFDRKMKLMIGGVDKDFHADPNGKKFLFVHFAGNNNIPPSQCTAANAVMYYPGTAGESIDGLISVGGIDRENHVWSGSCTGGVEILAPAEAILCASTSGHDHYRGTITSGGKTTDYSSGTSYATPFVSGIAARMLEDDPTLTPVELERRIKASGSFVSTPNAPAGVDRSATDPEASCRTALIAPALHGNRRFAVPANGELPKYRNPSRARLHPSGWQ
jgi:subtilisin family serine protease